MKKLSPVMMFCMSVLVLQGCSDVHQPSKKTVISTGASADTVISTSTNANNVTDTSVNASTGTTSTIDVDVSVDVQGMDSEQFLYLKQCVKNADALANLNVKYKKTLKEMYFIINEAKSYASSNVSGNVRKTITPLFEYKINYKCNNIEQLLIEEYNKKVQAAPVKTQ
ncbi:hypothetical protein AB9E48_00685 [Escherichia coli]|uniref:hypothetical protein n=1 Tax=Escherichia coli TaxID=562 RepID=UPI0038B53040